jgi:hypothetical protein
LSLSELQNGPFYRLKRAVRHRNTGRSAMPNGPDKPQLPIVATMHRAHAWARRRKNGMQKSLTNKRL